MVKRKLTKKAKKAKARKGKKRGGGEIVNPFTESSVLSSWGTKLNNFGEDIAKAFKGRGKKGNTRGYTLPKFPKGKGIFPGSHQGDWDLTYRNAINQGYSPEAATRAANAFNGPR